MLSDLFFSINYWCGIVSAIIGLTLCLLTIIIVITHRECHNFTNVLTCNTCLVVTLYFIFHIIASIYALRQDWQYYQPVCIFRAYCSLALCAILCYSYSIQAISRLFFAIFYKYRFLLTWRTHWFLIIANWIIGIAISIVPFFYENGFQLEIESRSCMVTTKIVSISMYVVITIFLIPLSIVTIIYGIILHHVHQSTRRVMAIAPNAITNITNVGTSIPNGKRELKLMQNLSTQTTIISFGGTLYLILVIWYAIQPSPPESFYLLAVNLICIATTLMMIALFLMNKTVKKIAFGFIYSQPLNQREQYTMTRQPITRIYRH